MADKKKWSQKVTEKEKWHAPEGLFKESPEKIAKTLKKESKDKKQAMSRLTFYRNRAGKNLSKADKERLDKAKEKLESMYESESKTSTESLPCSKRW